MCKRSRPSRMAAQGVAISCDGAPSILALNVRRLQLPWERQGRAAVEAGSKGRLLRTLPKGSRRPRQHGMEVCRWQHLSPQWWRQQSEPGCLHRRRRHRLRGSKPRPLWWTGQQGSATVCALAAMSTAAAVAVAVPPPWALRHPVSAGPSGSGTFRSLGLSGGSPSRGSGAIGSGRGQASSAPFGYSPSVPAFRRRRPPRAQPIHNGCPSDSQ